MMCKCGHGQMEHEPDYLYCDCEQYEPAPAPQEPAQELDVHTEHCCLIHGCKYGDDENCTVATKQKRQSFPCEDCHYPEPDEQTIRKLRAQLAAAEERARQHKEDTERLDWLISHPGVVVSANNKREWWAYVPRLLPPDCAAVLGPFKSAHEAIDAASKESQA